MGTEPSRGPAGAQGWRSALPWLGGLALGIAAVVALGVLATRERIIRNESAQASRILRELLPEGSYDNQPGEDAVRVMSPDLPGGTEPLPIYRARRAGVPVAAVMTVVARHGYLGPIRLLVSLTPDGHILAVRAIAHGETPGLGDGIDIARSDWIRIFTGRSLGDPAAERWKVRRDGGDFDQITGATVTSRAVVTAVRDAAAYFTAHRADIFAAPAD